MADQKISADPLLTAANLDRLNDYWPIIDASEPDITKNKRIKPEEVQKKFFEFYTIIKGATLNRFYGAGWTIPVTMTSTTTGVNVLRAMPMMVFNKMVLDTIQIEVVTPASGNIRLGIWKDNGSCYPGELVVDSGEISLATAGVFSSAISATLEPGLYWIGHVSNASATIRGWTNPDLPTIMGLPATMTATIRQGYWTTPFTYAALPNPFPAGATINNTSTGNVTILVRAI